ncbi:hypothetical protein ACROYT_G034954 [Oculina patagonica]
MNLARQVDILADTVYVKGTVALHGINTVTIYARKIVASAGSKIDLSAPNWDQNYRRVVSTSSNGVDGEHGVGGTTGL